MGAGSVPILDPLLCCCPGLKLYLVGHLAYSCPGASNPICMYSPGSLEKSPTIQTSHGAAPYLRNGPHHKGAHVSRILWVPSSGSHPQLRFFHTNMHTEFSLNSLR